VVNAYTLVLAALVLLGGSLGDRLGRRNIFVVGVLLFAAASALCGLAPNVETLVAARALQGVGGALLTPASLAILQASFAQEDRARAIGAWSGLTGVAAAIGPFVGGWLVEVANWRWVFLINLPVALFVVVVARRHVPDTRNPRASNHLDMVGSLLLALGLGALTFGLTVWSGKALLTFPVGGALLAGLLLLIGFGAWEPRALEPLLPMSVFASKQFVVANVITFILYGALGAVFFTLVVALQVGAGFSPLAAGLSLLPVTVLMLLFSSKAGALMSKVGPRIPMTIGPLVAALGVGLLSRVDAGSTYLGGVLMPTTIFGVGVTLLVTPLTATVLGALPEQQAGIASGLNNAVARTAGLLAVAAVPLVGGLGGDGLTDPSRVRDGFAVIARICAGLLAAGGLLSALTVSSHGSPPGAPRVARTHCAVSSPPVSTTADRRPPEDEDVDIAGSIAVTRTTSSGSTTSTSPPTFQHPVDTSSASSSRAKAPTPTTKASAPRGCTSTTTSSTKARCAPPPSSSHCAEKA
jgi:EmrB/QacA subfamily drug resistance transporter